MGEGRDRTGRRWGSVLLATAAFAACFCTQAGEVRGIALSQGATGTRAEIDLLGSGEFRTLSLHGPERLVVDLPASSARTGLGLPAATGIVKSVRLGRQDEGALRIVFDLSTPVVALKPRMEQSAGGARLVIEWPGDGPAAPAAATATATLPAAAASKAPSDAAASTAPTTTVAPVATVQAQVQPSPLDILNGRAAPIVSETPAPTPAPAKPVSVPLGDYLAAKTPAVSEADATRADTSASAPAETALPPPLVRSGMRPLVVAIDAGHGGQDSGAIGPTGKYEKNVTLAIARELARQVNATPGLKAFLVRDGDYFIPLNQRARKARAHNADIFVSIHADAAENRSANGSSVYVLALRGASSQRARWLADKENASDLVGGVNLDKVGSTLSSVLLDLAQSGHMKASEDAAKHVLDGLKRIGNNHKPQIERANFAVLRTSDMPAMLVETAFISNHEEERRLVDPAFQRKLAGAVLDGVQAYFTRQPPPGTLFAARAQAGQAAGSVGGGSP